jgi:hypothetical protein
MIMYNRLNVLIYAHTLISNKFIQLGLSFMSDFNIDIDEI